MKAKRRTEITVETHEVLTIRRSAESRRILCAVCHGASLMVNTIEAAIVTGVSQREIFRRIEANLTHSTETADGQLFVCLKSLRTLTL